SHTKTYS
ncbi:NADH dehydrogenase subunit family protein, partial [Chlamydia psittaci 01DC11]